MKILIGQTILVQGVTTAIGIGLGPVQVVIFNTIRTLLNTSKQAVNLINMSLVSEFSYAYGAGQRVLLNNLFVRCQQLNVSMSFILLTVLLLFGRLILNIWTNNQIPIEQPFYAILIAATFINSFWNGSLMLLVATNKTVKAGNAYFGFSIAILSGIVLLMSFGGLTTVGLMLCLFEIIMCFYVLKQSNKLVEWNLKSLWKFDALKN
jgi:O-antigen/teichoic acid export membrane protein